MLTFAQFERELTSERTKDKLLERANKGMWNGGGVPFGYKVVDKRLVPDEQKSQKLKHIFAIFAETGSLAKTYQLLKERKIFNDKKLDFSKAHLQSILRNPVYTGKMRFSGKIYQGTHRPLISGDLFNHVQTLHNEKHRKMRLYKDYLLTSLIHCAECSSMMTPAFTNKKHGRYHYYRCTKTYKQTWDSCSTRQINANRLERFVIDNLKRISVDKHYIDSSIFKLNFEALGAHKGLELLRSCSPIDPKTFQQSLKNLVEYLEKATKIDQALALKKYIKNIIYSKETIQINMLCPTQPLEGQSIKNPAPLLNVQACGWVGAAASPEVSENFLSQKDEPLTPRSKGFIKDGSLCKNVVRIFYIHLNCIRLSAFPDVNSPAKDASIPTLIH